jgi:hypothetical protein
LSVLSVSYRIIKEGDSSHGHAHDVSAVPKTVMNETVTFDGAVPEAAFLERLLEAAGRRKD